MAIRAFLKRCDAYADRRGISRARLSTLLFNDGKKLSLLEEGRDIGVRTLERAEEALSELEQALLEGAR